MGGDLYEVLQLFDGHVMKETTRERPRGSAPPRSGEAVRRHHRGGGPLRPGGVARRAPTLLALPRLPGHVLVAVGEAGGDGLELTLQLDEGIDDIRVEVGATVGDP